MSQFPIGGSGHSVYAGRRARLSQAMQRGVAIVPTARRYAPTAIRFSSSLFLSGGFSEPEAVIAGGGEIRCFLPRQESRARNLGRLPLRPPSSCAQFSFDKISPDELDQLLPRLLADQPPALLPSRK
jgi:hypothetical protein